MKRVTFPASFFLHECDSTRRVNRKFTRVFLSGLKSFEKILRLSSVGAGDFRKPPSLWTICFHVELIHDRRGINEIAPGRFTRVIAEAAEFGATRCDSNETFRD